MLSNYLKIALRNLRKNKIDSVISIGGLSIGLACCILLLFYIRFEWSYDNFQKNSDSIYRLTTQSVSPRSGEVHKSLIQPHIQSVALSEDFPEIQSIVSVARVQAQVFTKGKYYDQIVQVADNGFFQQFTFPLKYGDSNTALSKTHNVVLTRSSALKYFGKEKVIGETLTFRINDEAYDHTVAGVMEDIPSNSSMKFEILMPFENYFLQVAPERREKEKNNWYIGYCEIWVQLDKNADPKALEAKFPAFLEKYKGEYATRSKQKLGLQLFATSYFDQEFQSYATENSNPLYSYILGGIAIIILLIAGINFMSLTLGRSSGRYHEMGIRKSSGALKQQIRWQIIGEVFITCLISLLAGMGLAELFSPLFEQIVDKHIQVATFSDPILWLSLLSILLVVTLVTGVYPSYKVAGKNPRILFSSHTSTEKIPVFVKSLIAVQFALSTTFLIGAFVMQEQMNYIFNKDLGFSADNVISINFNSQLEKSTELADLFKQEAAKLPYVSSTSVTSAEYRDYSEYGLKEIGMGMGMTGSAIKGFEDGIVIESVDEEFIKTLDIQLKAGQNINSENYFDGILVNQAFTDVMGLKDPVNKTIVDTASWQPMLDGKKIVGVIEDYNFKSLFDELEPIVLLPLNNGPEWIKPGTILVKSSAGNLSTTVSELNELWDKILPEEPFKFHFLDEMVQAQYKEQQRWSMIIRVASFSAIALACFGLFGLAALTTQKRVKEIGIRKVFGASVASIVTLLSKDFVKLVIIGFVVAIPIAWYAAGKWLEAFAYKIELGPGIFVIAGMVALAIALSTISWQAIRSASANPADSLRSE